MNTFIIEEYVEAYFDIFYTLLKVWIKSTCIIRISFYIYQILQKLLARVLLCKINKRNMNWNYFYI